ncbi:putative rhamnogalacturonate lyase C [Leucoagaricus sp. SymC.cos]|nr:putative rhamnogalacturonate lyase C [Leucoagaricus sp. SymC.cos]
MNLGDSIATETACAYVYNPEDSIPLHPGPNWTRCVCISDSHSRTNYNLPPGDVFLHAGDLSSWGYPKQVMTTLNWVRTLDYPMKMDLPDVILERLGLVRLTPFTRTMQPTLQLRCKKGIEELSAIQKYMKGEEMRKANVHYLEYESFEFTTASGRKWKVYGCPASPKHAAGAFQYVERGEAKAIYDKIPADTEILLTHTPPKNCLDLTKRGKEAGCRVLRETLKELGACKLHVFGHIHEDAGVDMIDTEAGVRVAVNAAIERSRKAIVIDLLN